MDRIFSMEDMSCDEFWSSTPQPTTTTTLTLTNGDNDNEEENDDPKMNKSASQWDFEKFLQQEANSSLSSDDTSSSSKSLPLNHQPQHQPPQQQHSSHDYQTILQNKLNLACAAVALTKAPFVVNQASTAVAESATHGSADSQSGSRPPCKGSQDKDAGAPNETSSLSSIQKKPVAQAKQTTSCSSREQSDDDELEGELEMAENVDPADVKRVRRMLSNRESARRSRRRKQAHLTELETQVSQLRVENSSLLKRLTDISQKYSEAAVDNRVLKADVETLRAKVKMAEETVKRVTGMNPLLQAMSEITAMGMAASFTGSPSDSADAAVPVQQEDPKQPHFYHPVDTPLPRPVPGPCPGPRVDNGVTDIPSIDNVLPNGATTSTVVMGPNKMGRTASMQRVASLEHLQKRIRGGVDQGSSHNGSGEN